MPLPENPMMLASARERDNGTPTAPLADEDTV
jgi:hypothetical protein